MIAPAPAAPRLSRSLPPVYAAGLLRLLMPVVVLPLMSARLGADAFGRLSFILVWSGLLAMVVEGGFLAAATRLAVAADATRRWRLAQQIFSARCVLCLPAVLLSWAAAAWVGHSPAARAAADGLAIALLACALGWPATWYLQATQQLARWARVEIAVYAALMVALWAFAHTLAVYVALQLAASIVLAVLGWRWLAGDLAAERRAAGGLWSRDALAPGLRLGWTMMPVSIAGAAYSYALPAAASGRMPPAELGLYFMADRIVRAVLNAADPIFSVVYPRIVRLFEQGGRAALAYTARWAAGGVVCGFALMALGIALWPIVEPLLLARSVVADLPRLRQVMLVLGLMLPLLLGWKFLGYWMLGSGRFDTAYRRCMVIGGIAGVAGAWVFGGLAGALGLAWTAIGVELLVIAVALSGIAIARSAPRAA
jgi:O-antigen/teichoic acid export membrane protein